MSPSDATNKATRREWRELGFFYEGKNGEWRLVGSKDGLLKFRDLLLEYVKDPRNATISEHEHYGPYMYLEITTSQKADINEHCIEGTLFDLERLAHLIDTELARATPGALIDVGKKYCSNGILRLEVKESGFDPASADNALPRENQ